MTVLCAGEALIDLAPRGELLLPLPGGSPYNVAVGLGRLGVHVQYLGGLSTDAFGTQLTGRLAADGVDLTLAPRVDLPTTLAVVHLDPAGRATYGFYLTATSAAALEEEHLPALPDDTAVFVSLGAIGIGHVPTGRTLAALLENERHRRVTILDPNVRPSVFEDVGGAKDYAALIDRHVAGVDLVKVSDEDLSTLHPDAPDWSAVATAWARSGPALVVVTRGPDGATAFTADGTRRDVPGIDVQLVDTVGAGDAFTSGLLAWLDARGRLDSRAALEALPPASIDEALTRAVRCAGLTCGRAGSDPPTTSELDALSG